MLTEPTVMPTIVWAAAKLAAALLVLFLWYRLILGYHKSQKIADQAKRKPFPIVRTMFMVFLTALTVWFAQAELAYRDIQEPNRAVERSRSQPSTAEAEAPPFKPDENDSLAERTDKAKKDAKELNDKAKEDFSKNKPK